jgi:3-methyladenine DNA glycosylase AlkC
MRKLTEIPQATRLHLASGVAETADWTEWMATDMSALARTVAAQTSSRRLATSLSQAAEEVKGRGILDRLVILGRAVSSAVRNFDSAAFLEICGHKSDVVRQWAAYAVNDAGRKLTLRERLALTRRFAADHHMSVRECAWMAYRPHLNLQLNQGFRLLEGVSRSKNASERRFAVEVSRPRSVWGRHISELRERPEMGMALLTNVYKDESRYVRLAAGNWLNDASKTRPDWVLEVCSIWLKTGDKFTKAIVTRGLRTLAARGTYDISLHSKDGWDAKRVNGGTPC